MFPLAIGQGTTVQALFRILLEYIFLNDIRGIFVGSIMRLLSPSNIFPIFACAPCICYITFHYSKYFLNSYLAELSLKLFTNINQCQQHICVNGKCKLELGLETETRILNHIPCNIP